MYWKCVKGRQIALFTFKQDLKSFLETETLITLKPCTQPNDNDILKFLYALFAGHLQAMWWQVQRRAESCQEALGEHGQSMRDPMGSCNPLLTTNMLSYSEEWHRATDAAWRRKRVFVLSGSVSVWMDPGCKATFWNSECNLAPSNGPGVKNRKLQFKRTRRVSTLT